MNRLDFYNNSNYNVDYRGVYDDQYKGDIRLNEDNILYKEYESEKIYSNSTIHSENVENVPTSSSFVENRVYNIKSRILLSSLLLIVCISLFIVFVESLGQKKNHITINFSPLVMNKIESFSN